MSVHWEDPPAVVRTGRRGQGWIQQFAVQLREHPGKWARVVSPKGRDTFTGGLRQSLKQAGLEVQGRQVPARSASGRSELVMLWARWPE